MIIDINASVTGPTALHDYFRGVSSVAGAAGRNLQGYEVSDDELEENLRPHLAELDRLGIDLQLIGTPPTAIPTRDCRIPLINGLTQQWNNLVAQCVRLHPDRFAGIGTLPQNPVLSTKAAVREMKRCVDELGFVGVRINPDPGEGGWLSPDMGAEFWYPIYESLVELEIPGIIHGGASDYSREPELGYMCQEETVAGYSLLRASAVWHTFPGLKLILPHGGGYIPYQYGRGRCFRVNEQKRGQASADWEPFETTLGRLYFDTALFEEQELELLFRVCGAEHCLFGSDTPGPDFGIASSDPAAKSVKEMIERIDWLTEADRSAIFEDNARQLFSRVKLPG